MRVDGADLSHHNSDPRLGVAKEAGLKFLYHKATEGATFRDAAYTERRLDAAKAKVPFGAYHFASPDGRDARLEAQHFLATARVKPGDLIPMLDFETLGDLHGLDHARRWAIHFSQEVKRALGVLPLLYAPWDLDLQNIRWVPRYNSRNTPPNIPWDIWQFSNGALGVPSSFPGLPGNVDLNTFNKGVRLSDITIPLPEPELERTGWMRVITQNVKALPLMPQGDVIEDVALTSQQGGIIGWQEIGPDRYKAAVMALNPDVWSTFWPEPHGDARWYDSPISYRKGIYRLIDGGSWMLNEARPEVSVRREFTWVILEHKGTGIRFWVDNKHYIAGAWNKEDKPHKAQRPDWWRESAELEEAWTRTFMKSHPGLSGIKLGDYNANQKVMLREFPSQINGRILNYQVSERSIDQIILINASNGDTRWQLEDQDGELLLGRNSDHQGRRSTQRLAEM